MPILSRKDLERISRRVLFRYLTLSDRKMDRIDPVDFAEKICGLHFAFADMSVTGSILGLTSYSDVDLTISVPRGNGSVQEFHLNEIYQFDKIVQKCVPDLPWEFRFRYPLLSHKNTCDQY